MRITVVGFLAIALAVIVAVVTLAHFARTKRQAPSPDHA